MPIAEATTVTLLVKLGVVASLASILTRVAGVKRISTGSPGPCMRIRNARSLSSRISVGYSRPSSTIGRRPSA